MNLIKSKHLHTPFWNWVHPTKNTTEFRKSTKLHKQIL